MQTPLTVFVVDADPDARSTVRRVARAMGFHCEEYRSGRAFLESVDPSGSGCVVLEMRIPDLNGFEIQKRLASQAPGLPVLFVTGQATVAAAVRAMRAGAVHVLEKPVGEQQLRDALEEAAQRNRRRQAAENFHKDAGQRIARLTPRERQMMHMILTGHTNRATASALGVCRRTVELRRAKLMKKLEVRSLAELIRLALAAGDGRLPKADHGAARQEPVPAASF